MSASTLRRHATITLYAAGFFALVVAAFVLLFGVVTFAIFALRWLAATFPVAMACVFIVVIGGTVLCCFGALVSIAWAMAKDWYEGREEERRTAR